MPSKVSRSGQEELTVLTEKESNDDNQILDAAAGFGGKRAEDSLLVLPSSDLIC